MSLLPDNWTKRPPFLIFGGLLSFFGAYFYYFDITDCENIGKKPYLRLSISWLYDLGGKWAVVDAHIIFGIVLLFLAIRILTSRTKQHGPTHRSAPTDR